MQVMQRFEENLQALGFHLAPVAWDLAQIEFPSDEARRAVIAELMGRRDNGEG